MTKMEILSFICDDPNSITLITGDNVEEMDKEGKREMKETTTAGQVLIAGKEVISSDIINQRTKSHKDRNVMIPIYLAQQEFTLYIEDSLQAHSLRSS